MVHATAPDFVGVTRREFMKRVYERVNVTQEEVRARVDREEVRAHAGRGRSERRHLEGRLQLRREPQRGERWDELARRLGSHRLVREQAGIAGPSPRRTFLRS